MTTTLAIRDQTTAGEVKNEFTLEFLTERITVRELIRSRVHQEVKDYNAKKASNMFRGLIQPTDTETDLNGYKFKKPRMIQWEKQFETGIKAFEANQVLILVDDKQVDSLDQEIVIETKTRVTFLKLVPLVGG